MGRPIRQLERPQCHSGLDPVTISCMQSHEIASLGNLTALDSPSIRLQTRKILGMDDGTGDMRILPLHPLRSPADPHRDNASLGLEQRDMDIGT